MSKSAVFFDRDGVLNHDKNFVHRPEDFEWMSGAREAILWLNQNDFLVLVVTNQSGIGMNIFSEAQFKILSDWMHSELKKIGAHIDQIYHCPHHPEAKLEKFKMDCECRKPKSGMLLEGIKDWNVNKSGSFLVGDKPRDIQAAEKIGVRGFLFDGSERLDLFVQRIIREGNSN